MKFVNVLLLLVVGCALHCSGEPVLGSLIQKLRISQSQNAVPEVYEVKAMGEDAPEVYEVDAMEETLAEVVPEAYEVEAMGEDAPEAYETEAMGESQPEPYETAAMEESQPEVVPEAYEVEAMGEDAPEAYETAAMEESQPEAYETEAMEESQPEEVHDAYEVDAMGESYPQEVFYEVAAMGESYPEEVPDEEEVIERPEEELLSIPSHHQRAGCSVSIKSLGSPQPLYLKPSTTAMWPFSATGNMEIAAGQTVELFCTSTYSMPSGKSGSQIATCVSGTIFKIGTAEYDLTKVLCSSWPSFTARKTGATCNGGIMVESGFTVGTRFVRQMEMCFNEAIEVTRYVKHSLEPGSNYFQSGVARPTFVTAGFFGGKNVDKLYTQATQVDTINAELGGVAGQYIDTNTNVFLARGHMAAKADFVYGTEQRGTFLFLNAAPQWQVFNAGNWQRVEDNTRSWVSANKKYVDCYTGVYGVTTLPNKYGVQTPIYLSYDVNHNGQIPVPMLYFRVIIEPSTKKGVVLIGVNNPHLTLAQIQKDYILCPDVSSKLTWLTWKKTDITAGYSYACEVPEFAKANPYLPKFDVSGLLY